MRLTSYLLTRNTGEYGFIVSLFHQSLQPELSTGAWRHDLMTFDLAVWGLPHRASKNWEAFYGYISLFPASVLPWMRRKVQVLDASGTGKENKKEGHSTAKCNITYIRI